MNYEAVLFDFDGVLVQSIEDHYRSWNTVFAEYGVTVGWEEFASLEGQSLFWISERLCLNHGIEKKLAPGIASRKNQIYKDTVNIRFYDGALELLADLSKESILALVTGAHRDRFEHSVDSAFKSHFRAIITADDVKEKKPSPDPYLKAASELNIPPERCVVVENAPFGITSARRAGMKCIAVRSTLSDSFLSEADWIVDTIGACRAIIRGTHDGS